MEKLFSGQFNNNLDDKKRIMIPPKLREDLGSVVYITRGIDNCLFIFNKEGWEKLYNKLSNLTLTKKSSRMLSRLFIGGAQKIEIDKSGRILIPSHLIEYANLLKKCSILGVGKRIEIWNEELWNDYYLGAKDNLADIIEDDDSFKDIDI